MDYRIEQLRYLLREDPSSRIFYQLGELLRREGEANEAVEVLTRGLERYPRYVAAWVSLGRARRDLEQYGEAESAFETALELDRENPVAARLLGETAMARSDWLKAVKALKLARALSPADDELDEHIATVEEHLADDGLLEAPRPKPARAPARHLEVVSVSSDDPFADAVDDAVFSDSASDVFEIAETAPAEETGVEEDVVGATEVEGRGTPDETVEATATEPEAVEEGPVAIEPEPENGDAPGVAVEPQPEPEIEAETEPIVARVADDEPAAMVDEGSVGAWSTATAAGVATDEAWLTPTAELDQTPPAASAVDAWTEPEPVIEAAAVPMAVETTEPGDAVIEPEPEGDAAQVYGDADDAEPDVRTDPHGPEETHTAPDEEVVEDLPEPTPVAHIGTIVVDHQPPPEPEPDVADAIAPEIGGDIDQPSEDSPVSAEMPAEPEETGEPTAAMDGPPVDESADDESDEAVDPPDAEPGSVADALPGEDRGVDAIEVTRPIDLSTAVDLRPLAEPVRTAESETEDLAEIEPEQGASGGRDRGAEQRHELEHGVPLPTMTLAKLALEQDDRPLALATLASLIERDPDNSEARALLDDLRAEDETVEAERRRAARATGKIAALQAWLDTVRLAAGKRDRGLS